jgi:hypothetical protein
MEISGLEKIKITNAIVVFLIIINCLFFPLTILLAIDYKYFFDYDLLKIASAVFCVGCTNFGIIYLYTTILSSFPRSTWIPQNLDYLFQRPLVNTLIYVSFCNIITLFTVSKGDLLGSIKVLGHCDLGIFIGLLASVVEVAIKKKRALKKQHGS